jgi:NADPH:quinone reductase-like Zn-dependent oxidoreductase
MMTRTALVCLGPGSAGAFESRQTPRRNPAADEVAITVAAASVNPVDVRRAEGYGLRLLSLLGAGKFPMVSAMILQAQWRVWERRCRRSSPVIGFTE